MEYDVCVIGGAGHVGLPLSIAFAAEGKKVVIYDINEKALADICNGKMPFMDRGCEPFLRSTIHKTLFTSNEASCIRSAKFAVVIVGTPVDEHLNPVHERLWDFFKGIETHLRSDHILILRSTVFPGTTSNVRRWLRDKIPGIEVCFACERILEGKAMEELRTLPQIIAGDNQQAVDAVADLFRSLTKEIIITGCIEAELTKLFSNSWRYIQFATANQFYMISELYGADFNTIYSAMTRNYPRTANFPRPGFAAGPCLFKDTMQLNAFASNNFHLGRSAMIINEGLPGFLISRLKSAHDLITMTVGILGMAFKAESDDPRESLSYKLRKNLLVEAKEVLCSDEYIRDDRFIPKDELIRRSDIVIIGAPHTAYRSIDFKGKIIVDVWNHLPPAEKV
jgi:UDP-N-acetyl-D-mannosaminuronic acid dehydrogenase